MGLSLGSCWIRERRLARGAAKPEEGVRAEQRRPDDAGRRAYQAPRAQRKTQATAPGGAVGYRHGQHDSDPGDAGAPRENGLNNIRREAARLARYLQHGPSAPEKDSRHPPQLIQRDWRVPDGTLSVYAIGQAMVLRGAFNQADLIALRQAFTGQLVTLGDDGEHDTMIVWPPTGEPQESDAN